MDNDVLNIYTDDIEIAQKMCNSILDGNARNRAVANVLAVKLAERYLNSKNYKTDTSTGLHNIPKILENLDIADIYINGAYIDVRVYFSEDEISVPKIHFDIGMNPAAYMFIKLEKDLSDFTVTGFIKPEYIDKNCLKDDYYYVNEDMLISFYDIESNLTTVYDSFYGSKEILYSFVDGSIEESKITELMQILTTSENARATLIRAFKANTIFKMVSYNNLEEQSSAVTEDIITEQEDHISVPETNTVSDVEVQEEDSHTGEYIENVYTENEELNSENLLEELNYSTTVTPNEPEFVNNKMQDDMENTNDDQIDSLFTGEQEGIPVKKKKSSSPIIIILLFALIITGGYLAYNNFGQQNRGNTLSHERYTSEVNHSDTVADTNKSTDVAMPVETVDASNNESDTTEEATSAAIPAIEQHLDASVLVSNLKVDWEVPAGYASNTTVKRYLVKLGKIIQLNLKSELLLLNKPPISNRITVELTYNTKSGKFEIVGINESSGEKTVDETIQNTVKSALNMRVSSNLESFGKLQGNPVLVIHL